MPTGSRWPGSGVRRSRRGFSLVETMIAALLLGFAAMIFGAACPMTSQVILRGRNTDLASDACQKRLEFWRNVGYASLPAIPTGASSVSQSFTPPSDLVNAAGTVTFTRIDGSWAVTTADTGRVRVDAVITWGGSGVRGSRTELTTLMRR